MLSRHSYFDPSWSFKNKHSWWTIVYHSATPSVQVGTDYSISSCMLASSLVLLCFIFFLWLILLFFLFASDINRSLPVLPDVTIFTITALLSTISFSGCFVHAGHVSRLIIPNICADCMLQIKGNLEFLFARVSVDPFFLQLFNFFFLYLIFFLHLFTPHFHCALSTLPNCTIFPVTALLSLSSSSSCFIHAWHM